MTSIRSYPALAFAIICILGTIIVVFGKVITGVEPPTINHLYIALALIVTLGAGHFMWDKEKGSRFWWVSSLSFGILFVVGTVVCVALSGSRSAAIFEAKEHEYAEAVKKRKQLTADLTTAAGDVAAAKSKFDAQEERARKLQETSDMECGGGKGTKCDGKNLSAANAKADAQTLHERWKDEVAREASIKAQLASIPEPMEPNAELAEIARVVVMFVGGEVATVKAMLQKIVPYIFALLTEFGAIVFNLRAWGERKKITTTHVTIGEIANELRIPPRKARKIIRELNLPRPAEGWVWKVNEAESIKTQIQAQVNTVH